MVVPIWFDLDVDGSIVFTTWHETIKARSIRREPRVCICVDDEAPPFHYVRIDGKAQVIDDLELLRRWATRLAARYMGRDLADGYGLTSLNKVVFLMSTCDDTGVSVGAFTEPDVAGMHTLRDVVDALARHAGVLS